MLGLDDPTTLVAIIACLLPIIYFVVQNFLSTPAKKPDAHPAKQEAKVEEDPNKPKLFVLYGSQTGTAEGFAKILTQEAKEIGFNATCTNLAEISSPMDELPQMPMIVFCVATYGEGEPTDDARDFHEFMNSDLATDLLANCKYTLFSLGNRQYKHYQAIGRYFDKRLEQVGAKRIYARGEGDAEKNIEEDFEDWKSKMWIDVSKEFGLNSEFEKPIIKQYEITFHPNAVGKFSPFIDEIKGTGEDAKRPFLSKILVNCELVNSPEPQDDAERALLRSTRHIEFDITGSKIRYEAGDHLGVYAVNNEDIVLNYAKRLKIDDKLDSVFSLKHVSGAGSIFPHRCTVRTALTYYLDLAAAPRKPLLRAFAKYATEEKERSRLETLAKIDDEGKAEYQAYIKHNMLTPLDVLADFPSVEIPFDHFCELVPRLQPRYYSIASSSKMHPHAIHLCVSIVKFETGRKKFRKGLCSGYLEDVAPGDRVYVFVRHSNFHLPTNPKVPVIMVGPGTGIAPFIGFIQQRKALRDKFQKEIGDAAMYFGCRKKNEDFLYGAEMTTALDEKILTDLQLAFSRDQDHKIYVQNRLQETEEKVWKVISSGGCFYVCGDGKYMSKDVDRTVVNIIKKFSGKGQEEAEAFLEQLTTDRKLFRDVWSPN